MGISYSASTSGFYDSDIHGENVPADAVPISPARHAELLDAQAEGARIVPGKGGRPAIDNRPPPAAERRAALTLAIRREAARRIEAISPLWQQLNDLRDPGSDGASIRFAAIDDVRVASNAIEAEMRALPAGDLANFSIATNPAWPQEKED